MIKLNSTSIVVRWGDMDSMGHVNNTVYFRYCEQARMEWFDDRDRSEDEDPDSLIVIINAFCEFLQPVRYPCTVTIDMFGDQPGKSSFMSHYTIREDRNNGTVFANGKAKVAWVDSTGTKSVPLPSTVLALLEASS